MLGTYLKFNEMYTMYRHDFNVFAHMLSAYMQILVIR